MTDDGELRAEVQQLLLQVTRAPGQPYPGGASPTEIADLERRLGLRLPTRYVDWLRVCQGEAVGPGYVLGTRTDRDGFFDVASNGPFANGWRANGWLPIADDGCGNPYVLIIGGDLDGFVGFVDTADPDTIAYLVASDVWLFFRFFLAHDLRREGWPFAPTFVLFIDPNLARAPKDLLPWNGG